MKNKLSKLIVAIKSVDKLVMKKEVVFTLSHMRARTSLLSHILATNPEICGHNELHRSYNGLINYLSFKLNLSKDANYPYCKYLHDKILHNNYFINNSFIRHVKPKFIIITREPISTISSICKMKQQANKRIVIDELIGYYVARINYLVNFSDAFANDFVYIESDELITETATTLRKISQFLGLEKELQPEYKVFCDTGTPGSGDPSLNIQSGKILKNTSSIKEDLLSTEKIEELKSYYIRSCKAIAANSL